MRAQRNRIGELISEALNEAMQRIAPEARQKLVKEEFRRVDAAALHDAIRVMSAPDTRPYRRHCDDRSIAAAMT
jgi:hypothetical protein